MPLTPKYTWSETEASLEVTVDVPGVSRSKADVFATDAFLKVNFPPYLFALDLYKEVDDSRSSATIIPRGVVFKLFKREPGLWGRLEAPSTSDARAALAQRRNESIDRAYRALEEARKARLARRQQEDKNATQRSMDVDRRKRQEVERRKAEELAEERGRLEAWRTGLKEGQGAAAGDEESDYDDDEEEGANGAGEGEGSYRTTAARVGDETPAPDHPDYHGRGWRPPKAVAAAGATNAAYRRHGAGDNAANDGEDGDGSGEDEGDDTNTPEVNPAAAATAAAAHLAPVSFKPLPPPRAKLEPVQVSFTKLETGHLPAREQREEEIRTFRRQARAAPDTDADSVDVAERQPLFLKDKGDALFKTGNYRGALNAYSRAVSLDDSHASVRSNRAACQLALGDTAACVADCDRALELLADSRQRLERDLLDCAEAAALRRQLVRLLVRRAQARVAMWGRAAAAGAAEGAGGGGSGALQGALRDYEDAMRLSPSDPSLESDYGELLAAMSPADAAALRQRGDARFRSGDYEGAAEAFSALLGLPRNRVPEAERLAAFSNRAACSLVLERYNAAVADCDAGLALLLPPPLLLPTTATTAASGTSLQQQQQYQRDVGGGGGGYGEFGAAAGQQGLLRLTAWVRTLRLPPDAVEPEDSECPAAAAAAADGGGGEAKGAEETAASARGGCGLAAAAAAAAAVRLLTRRGAAAAHLQHFAAAAADHGLAAQLLRRLGEEEKAAAVEADAERMRALADGREQLPPRPPPLLLAPHQQQEQQQQQQQQDEPRSGGAMAAAEREVPAEAAAVAVQAPAQQPPVDAGGEAAAAAETDRGGSHAAAGSEAQGHADAEQCTAMTSGDCTATESAQGGCSAGRPAGGPRGGPRGGLVLGGSLLEDVDD